MALTKRDFSTVTCQCCSGGNHVLYFRAKCHPRAGLEVAYYSHGVLVVNCIKCKQCVANVEVSDRNPLDECPS